MDGTTFSACKKIDYEPNRDSPKIILKKKLVLAAAKVGEMGEQVDH